MSGIGSAIGGLLGSSSTSGAPPSYSTFYPNVGQNATNYQNLVGNNLSNIGTLQNTGANAALANYNTAANNPFANSYQQGAGTAANAYSTAGNNAINYGTNVANSAAPLQSYAQNIMQLGNDPNSAQYTQQFQGATDQANANNGANGITGPWAAGTTNQAQQGFNQNWQNNQLQRAIQSLNAGGSADQTASGLSQAGAGLQQSGAQDLYTAAGLPYNTAQGISQNQNVDLNNLITSLGGINNIDSNTMSSLLQYLNSASGYELGQNSQQQQAQAGNAQGGSILGGGIQNALGTGLQLAGSFLGA